jgi:hypothetical protein
MLNIGTFMQTKQISGQPHVYDFWLARGAIVVTAALNAFLINQLSIIPSWLSSSIELALLVPLSVATAWTHNRIREAETPHHWEAIHRYRRIIRTAAMGLTAIVTAINFEALYTVLHALLYGAKGASGQSLLIDALNIWLTNVVVFALWFWNLDRGGPAMRGLGKSNTRPDFQFPQTAGDIPGYENWTPGFVDYFFMSFTNATAFSPTDTMPLSARSKLLFAVEAIASLLTVGLVAARAVNILA